jgi:hypothetical protein
MSEPNFSGDAVDRLQLLVGGQCFRPRFPADPARLRPAEWCRIEHVLRDGPTAAVVLGQLERIAVAGGISAIGANSDAVHVRGDSLDLSNVTIDVRDGKPIVRVEG